MNCIAPGVIVTEMLVETMKISEEQAQTLIKLIDLLEDNDDVQTVTTNFEVSDEIMEKLMAAG